MNQPTRVFLASSSELKAERALFQLRTDQFPPQPYGHPVEMLDHFSGAALTAAGARRAAAGGISTTAPRRVEAVASRVIAVAPRCKT